MKFVVAIDGPAGTGKSSVARTVALDFQFFYVDTGAIYRALAYLVASNNIDANDIKAILELVPKITIVLDEKLFCARIAIDGNYVESELRTETISKLSSVVSQHREVREALLFLQRNLVSMIPNGAIFEGRDIGTVVFPHAPLKIFITATSETRARRRYDEIKHHHPHASYEEVLHAIKLRDERDQNRSNAPMQKAVDAHVIDTSVMTLAEVIERARELIRDVYENFHEEQPLW